MEKVGEKVSYRVYWYTWLVLLALTLVMIFIGHSAIARGPKISFLVVGMLTKASLIAAYFMHLRFEKRNLIFVVAAGILLTAMILWVFTTFDGMRILRLSM